jgi:hypothetical protein
VPVQQAAAGAKAKPEPMRIVPQPGSPLDQLRDRYLMLKAAADEAAQLAEDAKAQIKNSVALATGGYPAVLIAGNATAPALQLTYMTRGKFRREDLKRDHPQIHDAYWVPGDPDNGFWELREAK